MLIFIEMMGLIVKKGPRNPGRSFPVEKGLCSKKEA